MQNFEIMKLNFGAWIPKSYQMQWTSEKNTIYSEIWNKLFRTRQNSLFFSITPPVSTDEPQHRMVGSWSASWKTFYVASGVRHAETKTKQTLRWGWKRKYHKRLNYLFSLASIWRLVSGNPLAFMEIGVNYLHTLFHHCFEKEILEFQQLY